MTTRRNRRIIWAGLFLTFVALFVAALCLVNTPKSKAGQVNVNKNIVQRL